VTQMIHSLKVRFVQSRAVDESRQLHQPLSEPDVLEQVRRSVARVAEQCREQQREAEEQACCLGRYSACSEQ
jgi:ribosomal protein L29